MFWRKQILTLPKFLKLSSKEWIQLGKYWPYEVGFWQLKIVLCGLQHVSFWHFCFRFCTGQPDVSTSCHSATHVPLIYHILPSPKGKKKKGKRGKTIGGGRAWAEVWRGRRAKLSPHADPWVFHTLCWWLHGRLQDPGSMRLSICDYLCRQLSAAAAKCIIIKKKKEKEKTKKVCGLHFKTAKMNIVCYD